jgi:hypothetical protein
MVWKNFLIIVVLMFLSPGFVQAVEKPTPPPVPSAPEAPAPPDISGLYDVPERPGMKVKVFAHPAKPEKPQTPTKNPSPSPSATPAVNPLLACNLSDPDSASVISKAGWRIPDGNITYLINTSSTPSTVGKSNVPAIIKAGFDQYNQATSGKVNFVRGDDTTINRARLDGKNIITWGRASSGTLGVTYVWYYPSTGLTAEIDTVMNNRYKWTWSNSNVCADNQTYDAQNIMTHELGHWLGLADEYNQASFGDNTMFGYGSVGEVKKNTLTTGDKSGVSSIYNP